MSMSDCPKCWDTPCSCGYAWRSATKSSRLKQAAVVLGIPLAILVERVGADVQEQHPLSNEKHRHVFKLAPSGLIEQCNCGLYKDARRPSWGSA